jgi:nitroreductase
MKGNRLIKKLVSKNRSTRRFNAKSSVSLEILHDLVDLARLSPSAGNLQPLKYILVNQPGKNTELFSCLKWAAYLRDWDGPPKCEQPAAYIIMLVDTGISPHCEQDQGIAAQSIMLGAAEKEIAGCIIGSINRKRLRTFFKIPKKYEIALVIALGKANEEIVIDEMCAGQEDIQYWRDENSVHHVPKRCLGDVVLGCNDSK